MVNKVSTIVIEKERLHLYEVSKKYGMTSKQTIEVSQHLDMLLNLCSQFDKLKKPETQS